MSTAATGLLSLIQKNDLKIFRTSDMRTLTGLTASATTHALERLANQELVTKIKRGLWVASPTRDINPFELVPFLTAPWPSYVSLYSALSSYGVVEEIPHIVYAVSAGRPGTHKTPLGRFRFHHLPERLIWGYENRRTSRGAFFMAEREKAFLDLVYLALIPRSHLRPPHKRTRQWNLDRKKLRIYAKNFQFRPLIKFLKNNDLWD